MLLTEAEAKKKWCRHSVLPIVKRVHGEIVGVENVAVNRFTNEEMGARCIGSGCMAWRFNGFERNIRPGEIFRRQLTPEKIDAERGARVGFCGAEPNAPTEKN